LLLVNAMLLVSPGMAAGLAISLLLRFYWAAVAARSATPAWRDSTAWNEALYVGSHAALGGGIGLLFWLSWGFTALVQLSWWQRGAIFGLANALVFSALPLLIARSLLRTPSPLLQLLLIETLCTCHDFSDALRSSTQRDQRSRNCRTSCNTRCALLLKIFEPDSGSSSSIDCAKEFFARRLCS
jgi:hypothetical protein